MIAVIIDHCISRYTLILALILSILRLEYIIFTAIFVTAIISRLIRVLTAHCVNVRETIGDEIKPRGVDLGDGINYQNKQM